MEVHDLTHTEFLAYEAGRAVTAAKRWQAQADADEREGRYRAAQICREAEQQARAEADDAWRQLAALRRSGRS